VSFACPSCGTDYARKLARLDTLPAKVRCHRCGTVWHPVPPGQEAEPAPPAEVAPAARPDAAPPDFAAELARAKAKVQANAALPMTSVLPGRRRAWLAPALWTLALLLLIGAGGAFGYAYRDALPFLAAPKPVLADVVPAWTEVNGRLRLEVAAAVVNDGNRPATIDRVRVKFLSAQRAWIGERMVALPGIEVPAGSRTAIAFTVDQVPDGTASLEFVLGPSDDPPS
jgi:predicted Zn finger-like uncharacterized protein